MSLREHEIEQILAWVGTSKRAFNLYTDDNEVIPSTAALTIDQVYDMLLYAYNMGCTDATYPHEESTHASQYVDDLGNVRQRRRPSLPSSSN